MSGLYRCLLFVSLCPCQFVELTIISNFGILDLNGMCVFGHVATYDNHFDEKLNCTSRRCQVAVAVKSIYIIQTTPDNLELLMNFTSLGNTVQTLSNVFLTLQYPDGFESNFIFTVYNLNGYHKELLEDLQIAIPLDDTKLQGMKNQSIQLRVQSKCSCGGIEVNRDLHIDQISHWGGKRADSCHANSKSTASHIYEAPYEKYLEFHFILNASFVGSSLLLLIFVISFIFNQNCLVFCSRLHGYSETVQPSESSFSENLLQGDNLYEFHQSNKVSITFINLDSNAKV